MTHNRLRTRFNLVEFPPMSN